MDITIKVYILFVACVGAGRLFEMRLSQINRKRLLKHGSISIKAENFNLMVLLHLGILVGSILEVLIFKRPVIFILNLFMVIIFILSNLLRWWVIRTLREHWNVRVINSTNLGVISNGPYRYIKHPNYVAVFIEMLAIPLTHTAYITAFIGVILHFLVLRDRINVEDTMLMQEPEYVHNMGHKPKFIPRIMRYW